MDKSKIECLILDRDFSYLEPYFYNNPYALRCELGVGEGQMYLDNAKERAKEIYNILFPQEADAIIFNYWIYDHSDCGEATKGECERLDLDFDEIINENIKNESEQLKFLLENQGRYRHYTVRDLETYGDFDDEYIGKMRRNRVICYRDNKVLDYDFLIEQEINGCGHNVGFVSFQNECIFSVYDDRGCDIVFATHEKMKEFYHILEPYFLPYDIVEMQKRLNG